MVHFKFGCWYIIRNTAEIFYIWWFIFISRCIVVHYQAISISRCIVVHYPSSFSQYQKISHPSPTPYNSPTITYYHPPLFINNLKSFLLNIRWSINIKIMIPSTMFSLTDDTSTSTWYVSIWCTMLSKDSQICLTYKRQVQF